MIAIKCQTNLGNASTYFREHLSSGDYYENQGQSPGSWFGQGASELGLDGEVKEKDFLALCSNEDPRTGKRLTLRKNELRNGGDPNRRIFHDFTFSPQKSVSIQALVHGDDRIKEAHEKAVRTALKELEQFAGARVRSKQDVLYGKDRRTGNITAATFTHETSRAVSEGAIPDPQLHTHAVVFNCTKGGDQWKALQTVDMLKAQSYANAAYDHELCKQLKQMGYSIRDTERGWELANIDDKTIEKFSKRRKAILEKTAELEAEGATRSHHDLKDAVAHDARIRKQGNQTADALRTDWQAQMSAQELAAGQIPHPVAVPKLSAQELSDLHKEHLLSADDALQWAKEHTFERNCVVKESQLMAEALKFGRGEDWSIEDLKAACAVDSEILREAGTGRITTEAALKREKYILSCVENGKSQFQPLAGGLLESAGTLNDLQRQAAESILESRDFLTVFRGGAGTGKSYTLAHVANALEASGKELVVLAPQNSQVSDLRKDGFTNAKTLSSFLAGKDELSANSVVICDEAGQIAGEDMAKLMAKAKLSGARLILSGDTRQHGAVAACDSLRAIERYAQPHTAELSGEDAIQRQKVEWYRAAVGLAERGDTGASFDLLEKEGAIYETTLATRTTDAAIIYVENVKSGGSCLVLSQTNAEVRTLNESIRDALKETGQLDPASAIQRETLRTVDLTAAEKQLARSYGNNSVIQLNRKINDQLKAGTEATFAREGDDGAIWIKVGEQEHKIAKGQLDKISVLQRENIELCRGDKVQLKANVRLNKNTKLANGSILEYLGEDEKGRLLVADQHGQKHALPAGFKQYQHGYAVTSYASQGKTVDHVLISDSQCKAATSAKEYYVSISRGRLSCTMLTADKESLRDHIHSLGERDLASDLKLERPQLPSALQTISNIRGCPPVGAVSLADKQGKGVIDGLAEKFASNLGKIFERGSAMVGQLLRQIGMASRAMDEACQAPEIFR